MLILTRNVSQKIIIGDDIVITICNVKGAQVRVGIIAPKSISIHREEIYEKIQTQKNVNVTRRTKVN